MVVRFSDKWAPDKWAPGQMGPGTNGPRTNGPRTNGPRTNGPRYKWTYKVDNYKHRIFESCIFLAPQFNKTARLFVRYHSLFQNSTL